MSENNNILTDDELESVSGGRIEGYDEELGFYIGMPSCICPKCHEESFEAEGAGITYPYVCTECGYRATYISRQSYEKVKSGEITLRRRY